MNKQQIEAKLNVSHTTVYNWIQHFGEFFSDSAKTSRRQYTKEDLDTLATIAKLSHSGLKYSAITEKLRTGERENFENTTLGVDTAVIPVAAVEQIIDASKMRVELETVRVERDKLLGMLEDIKVELEKERNKSEGLLREMANIRERAARAEAQLELLREMMKKDLGG